MSDVTRALEAIRARMAAAESEFGRPPGSVSLLAVSKTQPRSAVEEAYRAGQRDFGENYLQEAISKIAPAATQASDGPAEPPLELRNARWHFIGPLQANKTRAVAAHFDWVHTVDRERVAERLNDQRPAELAPLDVCIQINVSGESTKSGVEPEGAGELAAAVSSMPRLRLRGLMTIPAPSQGLEAQRRALHPMTEAFADLRRRGFELDTLSMGMTDDLEAAIAEGATLVRVGTAVFGPRRTRR